MFSALARSFISSKKPSIVPEICSATATQASFAEAMAIALHHLLERKDLALAQVDLRTAHFARMRRGGDGYHSGAILQPATSPSQ